jgi:hypothetical protein
VRSSALASLADRQRHEGPDKPRTGENAAGTSGLDRRGIGRELALDNAIKQRRRLSLLGGSEFGPLNCRMAFPPLVYIVNEVGSNCRLCHCVR